MRKTIYLLAAAILAFASCQEWEPVFTLSYGDVDAAAPQSLQVTATIAQLKDLYEKHGALKIEDDNMVIAGKVISDDHSGNIYRELYIKDDTGVISVKIGLSSLYSDYRLGQTVYVRCGGLTIGQYNGMPQLGVEDPTGEYETAYLDSRYLIDAHVVKGAKGEPVQPRIVTEAELCLRPFQADLHPAVRRSVQGQEGFDQPRVLLVRNLRRHHLGDVQEQVPGVSGCRLLRQVRHLRQGDGRCVRRAERAHREGEHPCQCLRGHHQPVLPSAERPSGPDPDERLRQVRRYGDRPGHPRPSGCAGRPFRSRSGRAASPSSPIRRSTRPSSAIRMRRTAPSAPPPASLPCIMALSSSPWWTGTA